MRESGMRGAGTFCTTTGAGRTASGVDEIEITSGFFLSECYILLLTEELAVLSYPSASGLPGVGPLASFSQSY